MGRVCSATYPAKDSRILAEIMDGAMLNVEMLRKAGFPQLSTRDPLFEDRSIAVSHRAVYRGDMKNGGSPSTDLLDRSQPKTLSRR